MDDEDSIILTLDLEKNALYKVTKIVGGSKLSKLKKEKNGLVKIKIDEQIFNILMSKKQRQETSKMAVERAILSMI